MVLQTEILFSFLLATLSLVALIALIIIIPRFLHKKEAATDSHDMKSVIGTFDTLGNEIKSLRKQLVIKERMAALGEFSAAVAHEFRNPMAVIAGYAKLLNKNLPDSDPNKTISYSILQEIEQMNIVMEELLRFSKSEPLVKTDINLNKLISGVIDVLDSSASRIIFDQKDEIFIRADEILLKQALRNLIQNGVDSGDTVFVEIEDISQTSENIVVIRVSDNGPGVPADKLDAVFMPFYTTKEKGLGIGLAFVQKVAVAHGGSVAAENIDSRGASFMLSLPKQ
ncbi:MAG: ATP-binding protein [Dissulfurispiraceae bacterium]|jgi:signal transduction histidine kinase|nr:ATP-binding protein [Dissulfurispiraceae bacterium]